MVHQSELTGLLTVIGVFLQVSAASTVTSTNNAFLNNLWTEGGRAAVTNGVKTRVTNAAVPFNPYKSILPANPSFFTYSGSLTTPPCAEIVEWVVFETPVLISFDDLNLLRSAFSALPTNGLSQQGNSNRPVQPLNDRELLYVPSTAMLGNDASSSSSNEEDNDDDDESYSDGLLFGLAVAGLAGVVAAALLLLPMGYALVKQQEQIKTLQQHQKGTSNEGVSSGGQSKIADPTVCVEEKEDMETL